MPLVKTDELIQDAQKKKYAVPAYVIVNYESMKWAVEAAEAIESPMILMANREFKEHFTVPTFAAMALDLAKKSSTPIALHLDHNPSYDECMEAIECGFSSVMFDGSRLPYTENAKQTAKMVKKAHSLGVAVEGELGFIGRGVNLDDYQDDSCYTNPEEAARFVAETGVDYLAVAIGNSHGVYVETPHLDIHRLQLLKKAVPVPLVLHGTSMIPDDQVVAAIQNGIVKTNIATEFYTLMFETTKKIMTEDSYHGDCIWFQYAALRPVALEYFKAKIQLLNPNNARYGV